jgi:rSAM/selenodomain-associated transferase 1
MRVFPKARLLVFAKAPVPGQVKTRLIPALGEAEAARFHERLVRQTIDLATRTRFAPVSLWCSPTLAHPFFQDCLCRYGVTLLRQEGNDLGQRMAHAFEETLKESTAAVLIGTDCPSLSADDLKMAFEALQHGFDAVLGPAEDGGYVLIGLRRPVPELFVDMPWGSERVLAETRARLRALDLRFHELPQRWDVDRPGDLIRLSQPAPPP